MHFPKVVLKDHNIPRSRNKDLVSTPATIVEGLDIGSGIVQTLPDRDTRDNAIRLEKEIHLAGKEQYHLVEEDGLELSQCELVTIDPSSRKKHDPSFRMNHDQLAKSPETPESMAKKDFHLEEEVPVNNSDHKGP